jgi:hypothetical protein
VTAALVLAHPLASKRAKHHLTAIILARGSLTDKDPRFSAGLAQGEARFFFCRQIRPGVSRCRFPSMGCMLGKFIKIRILRTVSSLIKVSRLRLTRVHARSQCPCTLVTA